MVPLFGPVAALGARDVYAAYCQAGNEGCCRVLGVLHWNGATWRRDLAVRRGHWTRRYVPQRSGQQTLSLITAWIPGTRSVWGVSSIESANDPLGYSRAAIYKSGR
jgi:hypothetical protein